MLGFGKGGLGIAVAERPFADHIRADRRMEQRRIRPGRRLGIHDRRQRPVFDRNLLERVLGGIAVARQHQSPLPVDDRQRVGTALDHGEKGMAQIKHAG
jgi:hypothetical protein